MFQHLLFYCGKKQLFKHVFYISKSQIANLNLLFVTRKINKIKYTYQVYKVSDPHIHYIYKYKHVTNICAGMSVVLKYRPTDANNILQVSLFCTTNLQINIVNKISNSFESSYLQHCIFHNQSNTGLKYHNYITVCLMTKQETLGKFL